MKNEFADLYSNMLYSPRIVTRLSRGKGEIFEKRMQWLWGSADDDIFYIAKMLDLDDSDMGKALVFADYLTYIPFGERGYEAFGEILKEKGMSVADWRYTRFVEILDEYVPSDVSLGAVREYFDGYLAEEINCKNMADVTRALCRLLHSFETACLKQSWLESDMSDAVAALCDALGENDALDMKSVLALAPEEAPLDAEQIALLKQIADGK